MPSNYEAFMSATRYGWRMYTETQWGLHLAGIPYPVIVVEATDGHGCHWRWNIPDRLPNKPRMDNECATIVACFDEAERAVEQSLRFAAQSNVSTTDRRAEPHKLTS